MCLRYETTRALPIDYGMVNAVSVCSGMIFYRESSQMAQWQVLQNPSAVQFVLNYLLYDLTILLPYIYSDHRDNYRRLYYSFRNRNRNQRV